MYDDHLFFCDRLEFNPFNPEFLTEEFDEFNLEFYDSSLILYIYGRSYTRFKYFLELLSDLLLLKPIVADFF